MSIFFPKISIPHKNIEFRLKLTIRVKPQHPALNYLHLYKPKVQLYKKKFQI